MILCACEGAGDGYDASLFALGPQLAAAGVPAVIAFQGKVQMSTVARLIPVLLRELVAGEGIIDRSLAAARGALACDEWWQTVLWLSTRDGRLWHWEDAAVEKASAVEVDPAAALRSAIGVWQGRVARLAIESTGANPGPELESQLVATRRMIETLEAALRTLTYPQE